ncbi:MAG: Mut7-C RNAse domain-containing protein [Gallionella sp.]|nr:Mut7-C RNAse domain-containing protein [Gallionella sp.]
MCHCPTCERVYWRGSHYKRMRARLVAWQSAKASALPVTAV